MIALSKLFNMKTFSEFEKTYQERISSESVVFTKLENKPMHFPESYKLFFNPTLEMMDWIAKIGNLDTKLHNLFLELPQVARNQYILECIVEELQNTNEIEGVRSSRVELVKSAKAYQKKKINNIPRFKSMIASYNKLIANELTKIDDAEDIRKIYDYLLEKEIDSEDLPDGEIFRKDKCEVLKGSGSQKVIHEGLYPEDKIISAITEMIDFLNNVEGIPLIIRIIISHYYFGYIHPFYDGNGRTSRFISSIYLKQNYSVITSISLSRGCNANVGKYLKVFDNTNKFSNRGEMNEFIESMLEIIYSTQESMYEELNEKNYLLEKYHEKLKTNERTRQLNDLQKNLLYVLIQNKLFDSSPGLTVQDFVPGFENGENTIRSALKDLASQGLVNTEGNRPVRYMIDLNLI
ncbi:Fic family protein [Kurthia gibsonii]|uniref:Fic family protein n=1 Tax=Kurthia gibsonii TaxID=33946 RepID=UPI003F1FCE6F